MTVFLKAMKTRVENLTACLGSNSNSSNNKGNHQVLDPDHRQDIQGGEANPRTQDVTEALLANRVRSKASHRLSGSTQAARCSQEVTWHTHRRNGSSSLDQGKRNMEDKDTRLVEACLSKGADRNRAHTRLDKAADRHPVGTRPDRVVDHNRMVILLRRETCNLE